MNLAQWTSAMEKMQHSCGAPIDKDEIRLIGAYLAVSYGSATKDDSDVKAVSALAQKATPTSDVNAKIDVQALLVANACLGCHAIENKMVGPSFKDEAAKYKTVVDAKSVLADLIRAGGSGKWGPVPMPPMSGLSAAQAQALADFVLAR